MTSCNSNGEASRVAFTWSYCVVNAACWVVILSCKSVIEWLTTPRACSCVLGKVQVDYALGLDPSDFWSGHY